MTEAVRAHDGTETTGPAVERAHFGGFEILRAMAALMVVVHHAGSYAGPARTGHLYTLTSVMDSGVAVFFVLSGFLIYRPFVAAHVAGRPAQRTLSFWWRRVLRIVPAYWVALTFFWLLGAYTFGHDWWKYYLFLQIYSRYTILGGIVQAWSLCTEMTFYLLIPVWAVAIGLVARRAPSARARALWHLVGCAGLWLLGLAARVAIDVWWPSQRAIAFTWLPTNLDLFATGMALAAVSVWAANDAGLRARLDRIASWAEPWWAAAVLLFLWYAYRVGPVSFETGYTGWFWHRRQITLGLFTVLLMVPAVFGAQDRGPVRRTWSWRPIVWIGSVSYGIYLWHFDWMKRSIQSFGAFGEEKWPGWVHTPPGNSNFWYLLTVGLVFGAAFAAASWYLLERPLQRFKSLVGGPSRRPGPPPPAGIREQADQAKA
ncbi:acyltransferase family protein [Aquihabitans sp. McL0605]|uniref:acyltransferase family protein n=1 Tax=Aquihabitans sp. McL0605 TaxID=3415671 RepID=UPI003CE9BC35